MEMDARDVEVLRNTQVKLCKILLEPSYPPLPSAQALVEAAKSIYKELPHDGLKLRELGAHLIDDIAPGLNGQSLSPTYYGFVTGGVNPAARVADIIASVFDQNVQVHLPEETIATNIEDAALRLLQQLLDFEPAQWMTRTFTTGATSSNILGLGLGRQYIISQRLRQAGLETRHGEGIVASCMRASIKEIQVLTTMPHSSLGKAANILGIGSAGVKDVSRKDRFLQFDLALLEESLAAPDTASIVVISCGEVNTGLFATNSVEEFQVMRALCDKHGAWLHVDGAFGLMARALPRISQYERVRDGTSGIDLADSIAGDCHKLLNVPYDCGVFFSRHADLASAVFQNTNAAYLSSKSADGIPSPLNIRIENSARFRGFPVYAALVGYGRSGYAAMIARMVDLSRRIARFIRDDAPHLELLPMDTHTQSLDSVFMCVLFRARDESATRNLTERIKASKKVYASSTSWDGRPATRFAVAKWDVDVERDFAIVKEVLTKLSTG